MCCAAVLAGDGARGDLGGRRGGPRRRQPGRAARTAARWCGCGPDPRPWPGGWGATPTGRCCRRPTDPTGAAAAALARIDAERRALYEEVATAVIDVDDLAPTRWPTPCWRRAGRARSAARARTADDHRARRPRGALLRRRGGAGARGLLPEVLPAGVQRVAIVTQENVEVEVDPGVPSETFVVADGEAAKTLGTVERAVPGLRPVRAVARPTPWWRWAAGW